MVKYYPSITDDHRDWVLRQQVFFVSGKSHTHINSSKSTSNLPS